MALYYQPGVGILNDDDTPVPLYGSIDLPSGQKIEWGDKNVVKVPEFSNRFQYGSDTFQYSPEYYAASQGPSGSYNVWYAPQLLDFADMVQQGTAKPFEREQFEEMKAAALGIPMRDTSTLAPGWATDEGDNSRILGPGSPDLGAILLTLRDKMQAGQANPQEADLYQRTVAQLRDQQYRASVPQASDAFSPLGDNLFSALGVLGLGASGGLAAAPLFAGGAGLATTLGSLGTLAGVAGTGAGVLGQALDQPWLRNVGLGLGIAGGLAGGIGGLTSTLSGGVSSLSDAARLASSAGKVTGALGRIPGADPLKQASRYLGLAGQLGQVGSGVQGLLGAAQGVTQGVTQGATQIAQTAQDLVTQRGGDAMADFSYDDFLGWGGDETQQPWYDWTTQTAADDPALAQFLGWGGDETQQGWYQGADLDTSGDGGGGGWLSSVLGGLGSVGGFLGKNAGLLGPLASGLGSLGAGALGSQASSGAAGAQAAALNRGIDLQTAQWLQQQANQAPWLQAGQQALPQLQQLATQGPQGAFQPQAALNPAGYGLPSATPGWTPQTYTGPQAVHAGDYRYTPGQGPRAADYLYTPGGIPAASQYRYTPGSAPQAADYRYTPGAVPTLAGQELLAKDPGVQFRLDEGRRALEASAAARGGALSGPALAALQRQGQELSSQEYGNAWQRASQQAQMREGWQQYATQQGFGQAMSEAQAREQWAQQASQMGFGQAMSESQLREQVNQIASSQGWSQAQAETALREHLAQAASQQGLSQAMAGQGQQFTQGLQSAQWNQGQAQAYDTDLYNRYRQYTQDVYGRNVTQNEQEYQRQLQAYNSQTTAQQQQWNRLAALSGVGQTAVGQLGVGGQNTANQQTSLLSQLGTAQGAGTLGSAYNWNRGIAGATNTLSDLLAGLNA
jgi:hypothetical protein